MDDSIIRISWIREGDFEILSSYESFTKLCIFFPKDCHDNEKRIY